MSMKLVLFVCAFTIISVNGQGLISIVPYTTCKGSGTLLEVRISNCMSMPCTFVKGQRTTIQMDFIPRAGTTHVTVGANAQIGLLKLPFQDLNGSSACGRLYLKETGHNVGCSLVAGHVYTYYHELEILQRYPNANAEVKWELADATRQTIACFQLQVKIVG